MRGVIRKVFPARGYGFIQPELGDGPDRFFVSANISDPTVSFDDQLNFRRVEFCAVKTKRGPIAEAVKLIEWPAIRPPARAVA